MQVPHAPRSSRRRTEPTGGISAIVALTVAAVLGGYALALGFTGVPVAVAAVGGMIAGVVLVRALAR